MRKDFLFLFLFVVSVGCRREQALFQKSQSVVYESNKKAVAEQRAAASIVATASEEPTFLKNEIVEATTTEIQKEQVSTAAETEVLAGDGIRRKAKVGRKIFRLNRKLDDAVDKVDNKVFSKKRKRDNPLDRINSRIKIGIIFLLIAVVLSLISLNQLAAIFAIASIISLVFGLRKAFR
jgi:hypothetical protein